MSRLQRRGITAIASGAVLALLTAYSGATTAQPTPVNTSPFKVGFALALTGPAASFGIAERDIAQAMVDQLNKDGGIKGRKIAVTIADTKSDATEAARVVAKLVRDDGVIAVFGAPTSSETLAFLPETGREGVTVLTPASAAVVASDSKQAWYNTTFRVSWTLDPEIEKVYAMISGDNKKKVAILYQDDDNNTKAGKLLTSLADADKKVTVVDSLAMPTASTDVSAQALKVAQGKPDAVFIAASAVALQAGAIRSLRASGFAGQIYGMVQSVSKQLISAAGPDANGLRAPGILNPDDLKTTHPRLAKLVEPLGGLKNFGTFMGAQAMAILFEGLKSNPAGGAELAKAIEKVGPIEGFGARPVEYTRTWHDGLKLASMISVEIKDGKFVTLK